MTDMWKRPIKINDLVACKYVMNTSTVLTYGKVLALSPKKVKVRTLMPFYKDKMSFNFSEHSRVEYKDPEDCLIVNTESEHLQKTYPELFI